MMSKSRALLLAAALFVLILQVFFTPQPAWAAMTEAQARAMVESTYGVRVLKSERSTLYGKTIYLLTVINPGGNDNAAFQVTRLAVDPISGRLVSGFRHRTSGYDYADGDRARTTDKQPTDVFRQGWNWR